MKIHSSKSIISLRIKFELRCKTDLQSLILNSPYAHRGPYGLFESCRQIESRKVDSIRFVNTIPKKSIENRLKRTRQSIEPTLCKRSILSLGIIKISERVGFEPTVPFKGYASLAGTCLRPLSHLSMNWTTSLSRMGFPSKKV